MPNGDPEIAGYASALAVTATVAGLEIPLPLVRLMIGLLVSVLHEERAELSEAQLGRVAKAQAQFEKILAEDSTYPGIYAALAGLHP